MKDNFLTDSFITPAGRLPAQELCALLPASISLVLEVLSSVKTGNLGKYLGAQPAQDSHLYFTHFLKSHSTR